MIYQVGMLCKHFKGETLKEKNIYRIVRVDVCGREVDPSLVTYSGDASLESANHLIVYANIFQNDRLFAREYEDLSSFLDEEKQALYHQNLRVQPLTDEEIQLVESTEFRKEKEQFSKVQVKTR